ncbi:MAG: energy transducer TonB [Gammaproteobacteria bacterium]|nr:energy transducer TonB [Gammaproteobacteria bacterium]
MRRIRTNRLFSKYPLIGSTLLVCLAVAAHSAADGDTAQRTLATILKNAMPEYPPDELQRQRHGWVRLNYVVTKDGSVIDPIIEDSGGGRVFERSALDAARNWIYEPATIKGQPVEQSITGVMITFPDIESDTAMSGAFNRRSRDINRLLVSRDLEGAGRLIDDTFKNFSLNIVDLARLWMLRGTLAQGVGDDELQLASYRRAAGNGGQWLSGGAYRRVMTSIVSLELSAGDYSAAITHYKMLVDKTGDSGTPTRLRRAFDSVYQQIEKYEVLAVPARLIASRQCDDCLADWQYVPLRRNLAIGNIKGSLRNIDIRCKWQRVVDEVSKDKVWTLPEEWGECRIIVFGDPGTTFDLLEIEPSLRES